MSMIHPEQPQLRILTWNVWSNHAVQGLGRIRALSQEIEQLQPDLLCLQELAPWVIELLPLSSWWSMYQSAVDPGFADAGSQETTGVCIFCRADRVLISELLSFMPFEGNSSMDRGLVMVSVLKNGHRFLVANTHLESPAGVQLKKEHAELRELQLKQSLLYFNKRPEPNIIYVGDFNWIEPEFNRSMQQVPGWQEGSWADAWVVKHPDPKDTGFTYDAAVNQMVHKYSLLGNTYRSRLDRVLCKLAGGPTGGWVITDVQLVGTDAVKNLVHLMKRRMPGEYYSIPCWPSDHFGVLATLTLQNAAEHTSTPGAA